MYQGKEVDEELGLNRLDFFACMYDPVLGRWHVQDPMLQHASLYQAMGNNPVSRVDPDGMWDGGFDAFLAQRSEENRRLNLAHGQWLADGNTSVIGNVDHEAKQNTALLWGSSGFGKGGNRGAGAINGNRVAFAVANNNEIVAVSDGTDWSLIDKTLIKLGFYLNANDEIGYYADGKTTASGMQIGHTKDGTMVGTSSMEVSCYWISAKDLIIGSIAGSILPDAVGVGLGADASVFVSGEATGSWNFITQGPNAGTGAFTISIAAGGSNSLGASAHIDGTKYYYMGPKSNFTNEDFAGPYATASFSIVADGLLIGVSITACKPDESGGILLGITGQIGVSASLGIISYSLTGGIAVNKAEWP